MPLQKLYDYALQHVNRPKNINNIFFKGVKMSICVKKKTTAKTQQCNDRSGFSENLKREKTRS